MRLLRDSNGVEWELVVNVNQINVVRARVRKSDGSPFDLCEAITGDVVQSLIFNPVKLIETLHALCKDQAEKGGMKNFEAFAASFTGDALDDAFDALIGEMLDFFPNRTRETLKETAEAMKTTLERNPAVIRETIRLSLETREKELAEALMKTLERIKEMTRTSLETGEKTVASEELGDASPMTK